MKERKYSSFKEIDQDIRILELQREVDKERLKLAFQNTKEELYPVNILGGIGGVAKKLTISLLLSKILKKFK